MLRQVQLLAGAVMASLVMIALVLFFVFPADERLDAPPLWLVGAQVVAAVVLHLLVEATGYRTRAIHPETDPASAGAEATQAFIAGTIRRAALCESIALASVVGAFLVTSGGYAGLLTGAGISLALMAVHVWPGRGPVEKTVISLERDGGRSELRERLGLATGPVQEL